MNTCRNCQHWHQGPANPTNLTAEPAGECRACPPQAIVVPQGNHIVIQAIYPITPAGWPSCGHFALSIIPASRNGG